MIDRDAVNGALRTVRFEGVEEEYPAVAALVSWADEARRAIELILDEEYHCPMCGHINEHSKSCPIAALLAEWPKEADRG